MAKIKGNVAKSVIEKRNREVINNSGNVKHFKQNNPVSPETYNPYSKAAVELRPLLKDRFTANNNYKKIMAYEPLILEYSVNAWQNETGFNYLIGTSVPKTMLTKEGNIKEEEIIKILQETENEFDLKDKFSFVFDVNKFQTAKKTLIGHTFIETLSDHGPCILNRQLFEATIDDNKYLFISDCKFYQDAPNATFPLFLLVNGLSKGVCQIGRIDSCGHINVEYLRDNGYNDIKVPAHVLARMNAKHENIEPNNKHVKFALEANSENHIHLKDKFLSLCYAAAKMVNEHKPSGKSVRENEFLKYNAQNLDPYYANNKAKQFDAEHNGGIIRTDRLVTLANNYYNFENREYVNNVYTELDTYRKHKVKREKYYSFENIHPASLYSIDIDCPYSIYVKPGISNDLIRKLKDKIANQQREEEIKKQKQLAKENMKQTLTPAKK